MSSPKDAAKAFTIAGLLDESAATRRRFPIEEIEVSDIADHPGNAVYSMDEEAIGRLAESIRKDGLTDIPLVRKLPDGGFQMISGHRRMAAYRLLSAHDEGYARMPCRIVEGVTDEQAIALLQDIAAEISRASDGAVSPDAPRVLLTGVPTGLGSHKVIQLLEECGASIVCIDNCTCYKKVRLMMDETADPLTELAGRYLDTPCSVMSPNPNRYTALRELTEAFQADAVVDLTWQGCQTYDVESWSVKKFVREELDLPFLQIVTDYSEADTEQLKVRIEAFLEMLN